MGVFELALAGLGVGLLVGMTGMGGGAILTPLLVLFFGINPAAAVGSDLAVSLAIKPVGAAVHHRAGTVRWDVVRWLLPTAVPAGFVGAYATSLFDDAQTIDTVLRWGIGAVLVVGVVAMTVSPILTARRAAAEGANAGVGPSHTIPVRPVATLLVGLVGGLLVGFTSIGSGSLIIVALVLLHPGMRPSELVGTDLVQAVPLVGAALVGHLLFGDVQFALSGALILGAIPGTLVGARLSTRVPGAVVKSVLSVVLTGSALALWGVPGSVVLGVCASGGVALAVSGRLARRRRGAVNRRMELEMT